MSKKEGKLKEEVRKLREISLGKDNKIFELEQEVKRLREENDHLVAQILLFTEIRTNSNITSDEAHDSSAEEFHSLEGESKSSTSTSSVEILGLMRRLAVNNGIKTPKNTGNTGKRAKIRFVPPLSSTIKNVACQRALDFSDSDDEEYFIPETPNPARRQSRIVNSPERRRQRLAHVNSIPRNKKTSAPVKSKNVFEEIEQMENVPIANQSTSANSSGYDCDENSSDTENSRLSVDLHATFSFAAKDYWPKPDLKELKITGHDLYGKKLSGYVLVKIQKPKLRNLSRACKEKKLIHYVALLTGEKYEDSSKKFKAVFFKRSRKYEFVESEDKAFEVDEKDVVCHLPIPKTTSQGKQIFPFNFEKENFKYIG